MTELILQFSDAAAKLAFNAHQLIGFVRGAANGIEERLPDAARVLRAACERCETELKAQMARLYAL